VLTFYDSFHGIGGFRYGLEQAGMECVGGCEIDKYACQAYGVINDEECEPTDITTVDPVRLPNFDVFVGGFPCQDLSIAGQRKGFEGKRSVLFFEILRICEVKRPTYILLENVTGLLSHNGGETFGTVLKSLDELGYDAEWQVYNSLSHVPQNRERIFIVGHLRGRSTRTIFPFGEDDSKVNDIQRQQGHANCLTARYEGAQATGTYVIERQQHAQNRKINIIGKLEGSHDQNSRVYGVDGIAPTLGTMQGGGQEPKILQNNRIRRLTPLECFRLQSYPDWWYYKLKAAGISDSQLYKMAGNGVTSEVARQIGSRLAAGHLSTEST
jgi:DNA (cytosine-5)-methyltransferase 1